MLYVFIIFRYGGNKFWPIVEKIFRRGYQNCILGDHTNNCGLGSFWKKLYCSHHLWTLSWKFLAFCRWSFSRGCQYCILRVHRNILRKKTFFFGKIFWCHFGTLSEKTISNFCRPFIGAVVETSFWVSMWALFVIFFRKFIYFSSFSDIERKSAEGLPFFPSKMVEKSHKDEIAKKLSRKT